MGSITSSTLIEADRENWLWDVFNVSEFQSIDENQRNELYARAHDKVKGLHSRKDFWRAIKKSDVPDLLSTRDSSELS